MSCVNLGNSLPPLCFLLQPTQCWGRCFQSLKAVGELQESQVKCLPLWETMRSQWDPPSKTTADTHRRQQLIKLVFRVSEFRAWRVLPAYGLKKLSSAFYVTFIFTELDGVRLDHVLLLKGVARWIYPRVVVEKRTPFFCVTKILKYIGWKQTHGILHY